MKLRSKIVLTQASKRFAFHLKSTCLIAVSDLQVDKNDLFSFAGGFQSCLLEIFMLII